VIKGTKAVSNAFYRPANNSHLFFNLDYFTTFYFTMCNLSTPWTDAELLNSDVFNSKDNLAKLVPSVSTDKCVMMTWQAGNEQENG
jgi:hypothetical protein